MVSWVPRFSLQSIAWYPQSGHAFPTAEFPPNATLRCYALVGSQSQTSGEQSLKTQWLGDHVGFYDILRTRCHRCRGLLGNMTIQVGWVERSLQILQKRLLRLPRDELGLPAGWAWPHSGSEGSQCQVGTLLATWGPHNQVCVSMSILCVHNTVNI